MSVPNLLTEASRQLTICNSCRYCEGLCPVFRTIETRRRFAEGDVYFLANLCHDCRSCYYACMFTPPHEFAINIPQLMADVRTESYRRWSWPRFLAQSFKNHKIAGSLASLVVVAIVAASLLLIPIDRLFARHIGPGAFYEIVPYAAMVIPALALCAYGAAIWFKGGVQFWYDTASVSEACSVRAMIRALSDVLQLKYLEGGGPGCSYPGERPSSNRRVFHSLTFYGFLLALASTTLAFIEQEFFHILPPYALASAPVLCGVFGGFGLVVGTSGLLWFKLTSDRSPAAQRTYGMDYAFLASLDLAALTGILTLALRSTNALGTTLVLHLASVAALFATAPYGKFVHVVYRILALLRYQIEQSNHQRPLCE